MTKSRPERKRRLDTPERMAQIGTILFGPRFRARLARTLGYDARTVRGWFETPPRSGIPLAAYQHAQHLLDMHRSGLEISE